MWIATQDITGQAIFVWLNEEQIELRKRILGAGGVVGIGVVGACKVCTCMTSITHTESSPTT